MATTPTSIANLALSHLGASTITDIEAGTSKEARVMAMHYPLARKEVLRSRRWTCATARATLQQSGQQPDTGHGFTHAHALPSKFLRLLEVNGDDVGKWADAYAIEQNLILSNSCDIWIRYTFDQDNPDKWDSLLLDAVAVLLAAKTARSLTGSEAVESALRSQYERLTLPKASTADGSQDGSGENNRLLKLVGSSASAQFRRRKFDDHGLYRDPVL